MVQGGRGGPIHVGRGEGHGSRALLPEIEHSPFFPPGALLQTFYQTCKIEMWRITCRQEHKLFNIHEEAQIPNNKSTPLIFQSYFSSWCKVGQKEIKRGFVESPEGQVVRLMNLNLLASNSYIFRSLWIFFCREEIFEWSWSIT